VLIEHRGVALSRVALTASDRRVKDRVLNYSLRTVRGASIGGGTGKIR
jgi:hypothetical protein